MALKIVKDFTKVNFTAGGNNPKYITIHYTGNRTDTAKNNANYFRDVKRYASAHYFVDRDGAYQVVKDTDQSWAVGKNYGNKTLFGVVNNRNSISIEMCSTNGKIADKTYKNTVELVKSLMKKYDIDASHVYRHWDICNKVCPGWNGWGANGQDDSIWKQFKKDIAGKSPKPSKPSISKPVQYYKKYTESSYMIDTVLDTIGADKYVGGWKKRKPIAIANDIKDYTGTESQNTKLIKLAKKGKLKKPD